MFIMSKRNFLVRLADGSAFRILKDFTGDIPENVADSELVKLAIKGGLIVTPETHKDAEIIEKIETSDEVETANDIRTDVKAKKAKK